MQNSIIAIMDPQAVMPGEQIQGDKGEIQILHYDDNEQEAESLAEEVERWPTVENLPPSEVAVLVPRLPEQYCEALMSALRRRGIKFRKESQLQDLSVEGVTQLPKPGVAYRQFVGSRTGAMVRRFGLAVSLRFL